MIPQGWRWLDHNGNSAAEQYQFSRKIMHLADILNYSCAYAYDHLWGGANYTVNRDKNFFECFTFLSSLLTSTSRIRVGQIVTCNSYRNPALLAKMISTMDVMSNGRMELGIGAGWFKEEYLAYGYDYKGAFARIEQLEEALSIIKSLWTEESSTLLGRHYSVNDAMCYPKPLQKPHPPITIGGTGEKYLLRVVAKHADSYNHPFDSPRVIKKRLSILKEHCDAIGRHYLEIERSAIVRCMIREGEEEINHEIMREKREGETVDELMSRISAIIGTPEKVVSKLEDYIDVGITTFIMHFVGLNEDSLKLFNSKVITKI
jgi:F420-dependent oxidoreductase-like protein